MPSVKKFGGSSVATVEQIKLIASDCQIGEVIVLSAKAGRTETLISTIHPSDPLYSQKVGMGEYESCLRLYLELSKLDKKSIIIHDSKLGLSVDYGVEPKVSFIKPDYIQQKLKDHIVIAPGFQARTLSGEHCLLSRGGSDETAVALSIGLDLPCIIYSDIAQIYGADNQFLQSISYQQLLELIDEQEAPMSRNSIELAMRHNKQLVFRHWNHNRYQTIIS